jgi:hypothetical protein
MTLQEIIQAMKEGKTIHWGNEGYTIVGNPNEVNSLLIKCGFNGHCIGLTWLDGVTMNGKEEDFFVNAE